jgi:hypothetical protein
MIRVIVLSLLELIESAWAKAIVNFIASSNTRLLSEEPGNYTVVSLLAELSVRAKTVSDAGIESVGMAELQRTLHTLDRNAIVKNYVFKSSSQTGIVYMDGESKNIVGAILIQSA